jgi:hypothetical protein
VVTRVSIINIVILTILFLVFLTGDLIPSGVSFVLSVLLLSFLMLKSHKISSAELILILPLVIILMIGTFGSLFQDVFETLNGFYLFGKDIWYFLKPIVYILTGFYLWRQNLKKEVFISLILYVSLFISVHHIIKVVVFVINAESGSIALDVLRWETGPGNLLEVYSLAYVLLLIKSKNAHEIISIPRWIIVTILSISIILSFSRTLFLAFIISCLAMQNFFSFKARTFINATIVTVTLFIIITLSMLYLHKVSEKDSVTFDLTDKYLNSFNEITYEKENPTNEEINKNWRGLETSLALKEFSKGNLLERIFGFGFGKTVFIGYSGLLGIYDPNIPRFHNGFIEILLKTGYLGLILYILYFYFTFRAADFQYSKTETDKLLKAVLVTSFVITAIISGLYNKSALDTSCVISGYLMGISLRRKHSLQSSADQSGTSD